MKNRTFNILNVGGFTCFMLFAGLPFLAIVLSVFEVPDSILKYLIYAAFAFFGLGFVMWIPVVAEAGRAFGQCVACMVISKAMKGDKR